MNDEEVQKLAKKFSKTFFNPLLTLIFAAPISSLDIRFGGGENLGDQVDRPIAIGTKGR